MAWNERVLVIQREAVRGPAVGCIAFHEKVFKLKLFCVEVGAIGIVLPCGLRFGPGLDPKLAIIICGDGTLPSGYRSL